VSQQTNQLRQVHAFQQELEQQLQMSQIEIENLKQLTLKGSQTDTMSLNLIKLMDSVSSQLNQKCPSPSNSCTFQS